MAVIIYIDVPPLEIIPDMSEFPTFLGKELGDRREGLFYRTHKLISLFKILAFPKSFPKAFPRSFQFKLPDKAKDNGSLKLFRTTK